MGRIIESGKFPQVQDVDAPALSFRKLHSLLHPERLTTVIPLEEVTRIVHAAGGSLRHLEAYRFECRDAEVQGRTISRLSKIPDCYLLRAALFSLGYAQPEKFPGNPLEHFKVKHEIPKVIDRLLADWRPRRKDGVKWDFSNFDPEDPDPAFSIYQGSVVVVHRNVRFDYLHVEILKEVFDVVIRGQEMFFTETVRSRCTDGRFIDRVASLVEQQVSRDLLKADVNKGPGHPDFDRRKLLGAPPPKNDDPAGGPRRA